jgi:chromosome partitioning protein
MDTYRVELICMILVIGSEKGGVGKSTLAINLAIQGMLEGVDTLLVDADVQGSCNDFSVKRDELDITPRLQVNMKKGKNLNRELSDLQTRYSRLIVDTGGRDSVELRSALLIADVVLIPCRPTQLDLWASEKIFSVVDTALDLNENLSPRVLISQAHTNLNVTSARDASQFLSGYPNITLCNTVIYERQVWQKSILEGRSVVELKSNKASNELKLLYGEIFNG